jgi:hypothetical protein
MATIDKVAEEAFRAKKKATLASIQGNTNKFFVRDGATKSTDDEDLSDVLIAAVNRNEQNGMPVYQDRKGNKLTTNTGLFYGGCYVNAIIDVFGLMGKHTGLWATLGGLQFVRDGESFGGAIRLPDDAFEALDSGTEEDPLAGLM